MRRMAVPELFDGYGVAPVARRSSPSASFPAASPRRTGRTWSEGWSNALARPASSWMMTLYVGGGNERLEAAVRCEPVE